MPEKSKNPFVVEVEKEAPKKAKEAVKPEQPVAAKVVTKPEEPVAVEPKAVEKPAAKLVTPIVDDNRTKIQWGMFFAGVVVTLVIVGVSGGLWWAQNRRIGLNPAETASPTPEVVVEATPTPTPMVVWNRSEITVDVLNASGITGKAGEVAAQVEELGYQKGTVGNATQQAESTISFSEDTATLSALIKEDLGTIVDGLTASEKILTGTGLVQIVIGE